MSTLDPGSILITGTTGQVGGEILRLFQLIPRYAEALHTPTRSELDLTSAGSIRAFVRDLKPRWIINPAAYTAVDKAESEPDLAHAINADAPRILGEEARKIGAAVLHFSTDYIFSGASTRPYREDDPPGPLSVYGHTKLAGEIALAAACPAHIIVRTSWVYSSTGRNFLLTILRLARERAASGQPLKIVNDQYGAPTSARELARVALNILMGTETATVLLDSFEDAVITLSGVYHASAAGQTSWFGFAREIVRQQRERTPGAEFAPLVPIPTSEYPTPARRPVNSRLNCKKLDRSFGLRLRPWKEELSGILDEIPPSAPVSS